MSQFVEQVEASILMRQLLPRGSGVLVAVSGGLDSMVLLNVLTRLAGQHQWRLAVAHFNHRLRGRSSDADERLVERTARKLGLRFIRGEADVRRHASQRKVSVEMAARELRHAFLAHTAVRVGGSTVALAQHADDQVELFFLRLLRGAGSEGLAGMKMRSVSPADRRVTLVRPLLDRTKEELRAFAEENRIVFREDTTNAQLAYQRNRIRHELLPLLKKKYQPALTRVILRQMEILGAESEAMAGEARRAVKEISNFKFQISNRGRAGRQTPAVRQRGDFFAALPIAVQRRCLEMQAVEQGITADFELIEELRGEPERRVTVGEAMVASRDAQGRLSLRRMPEKGRFDAKRVELALQSARLNPKAPKVEETLMFDHVEFRWRILQGKDGIIRAQDKQRNCESFDADKVGARVILRHWQAGDRFQPIGMASTVKLQDLFTNQKVPAAVRHELVIGVTERGEIFWVEGLRIGERFKLDKTTERRLQWSWKRLR